MRRSFLPSPIPLPVLLVGLLVLPPALFLRSYSLPPAPDRRGGTTVFLGLPTRSPFGSPRADCVAEDTPVIPCVIASVARAREDGIPLLALPFCATCYDWSGRLALLGRGDPGRERLAQIARLGW